MTTDWKEVEKKYYMQVVRRQPIVIVRGEGTRVWDDAGKEYLDFTGGWAVVNVGHANPVVAEAIAKQAKALLQTSNQFYTIPQLELARILVDNSCMDRIFIANSGAEANEGMIKLARKYGITKKNGAHEIITMDHSFHGRTLVTMAASGKPLDSFLPAPMGFKVVEYNNLDAIKRATTEKTAAVMMEPVQGEGGVNVPSKEYMKAVRKWCTDNGMLLIFDEVQSGIGRLGTLFGYQAFDVEPDAMSLAKGLGGGAPIGAFLTKEFCNVLAPGDHGSTFGGNPLASAAAYAAVKYAIDNNVPANAVKMGERLRAGLGKLKTKHSFIKEVRGVGLLNAVEFNIEISAATLTAANGLGLLLNAPRPNIVRWMPPLTVNAAEVDKAVGLFEKAIVEGAKTATAKK
ncbi:MAG: aspartate aminotransferase family protein [SAR202 cluster bacterium]|nr:aspartate aminotransferase family protein [SAR202 cluster bacterium]